MSACPQVPGTGDRWGGMAMRKQRMSRRIRDRMTAALAMLGTAVLMTGFVVTGTAGTAQATGGGGHGGGGGGPDPTKVCAPLDSGKIDTPHKPTSVTLTAPQGKLITGYCVKAASSKHGFGPVYVDVAPVAEMTIGYPGGKGISHYSFKWKTAPPPEPATVDLDVSFVPDCEETNQWVITNPSEIDVKVYYGWKQSVVVPAGGSFTFTTPAAQDWTMIFWGGKHSDVAFGKDTAHAGEDRTDCEPELLPVVPEITWTDPCGTENDTVDGVPNDGYTFVVDEETGTVTFTPVEGYYLDGPETLTAEWTDVPCPLEVTPVEPTVVQSEECDVEGSYTIPETAGVQYLLDGEPIEAGTYPGPEAGVLTAEPIGNTVLTIEDWSFDLVVEPAEVCEVAPTEASDVCTNIAGVQTAVPAGYSLVQGLCVADEVRGVETEVPAPAPAVAPAAGVVPTGVDAGFVAPAAEDTGSPLGLSLIAGGLMMLVAAGALQTGRLRRGAHEI